MDLYKQILDPTLINCAITCSFCDAENLVVAKGTILEVYALQSSKLKLVARCKLQGRITEISAVPTMEDSKHKYLMVSTHAAKLSLVKWNFTTHAIETVSLHYYENYFENHSSVKSLTQAQMIADPNGYCVCMVHDDVLAFLPFNSDSQKQAQDDLEMGTEADAGMDIDLDADLVYRPTFMVAANKLDPTISQIVDCAFLSGYREPTLAVLFAPTQTWAGNLKKSKDTVQLVVLSLDLVHKTSTTIISVTNLPYDTYKVVSLVSPLNGCLLLGCNQLLHVDSSGACRGIPTNKYASMTTSFRSWTHDQSDLDLNLEDCLPVYLPGLSRTKVLLISNVGVFYWLDFQVEGRIVRSFELVKVPENVYSGIVVAQPRCAVQFGSNSVFIAHNSGDAVLLNWAANNDTNTSDGSGSGSGTGGGNGNGNSNGNGTKAGSDADSDDDIDYSDEEVEEKEESFEFAVADTLQNLGPVAAFTNVELHKDKFTKGLENPNFGTEQIVAAVGTHKNGSLAVISPILSPEIKATLKFSDVDRVWSLNSSQSQQSHFLITSSTQRNKSECFAVHEDFKNAGNDSDWRSSEFSLVAALSMDGKHIVHVTPSHVYVYEVAQTLKLVLDANVDLETVDETLVSAVWHQDHLVTTTSLGRAQVFCWNGKRLVKVALPQILRDTLVTCGTVTQSALFGSVTNATRVAESLGESGSESGSQEHHQDPKSEGLVVVLVTGDNRVVVFAKDHGEKAFTLAGAENFGELLSLAFYSNLDTVPDPFIKQVSLSKLGDQYATSEYLTMLTIGGETYMYELFFDKVHGVHRMRKVPTVATGAPENAFPEGTSIERRLVEVDGWENGLKCMFITGRVSFCVVKTRHSYPRVFQFTSKSALSFTSFKSASFTAPGHNAGKFFNFSDSGSNFLYVDDKSNARVCTLRYGEEQISAGSGHSRQTFDYSNQMPVMRICMGAQVTNVACHGSSNTLVVATQHESSYESIDEEGNVIAGSSSDKPHALALSSTLLLVNMATWTVVDEIVFAKTHSVLCLKSSKVRSVPFGRDRELVIVGTGRLRSEDLGAHGAFHLYEIIGVVPEIGRPDKSTRFKEIFQETTKGAVTAATGISGRFLVSQGQKVIVRDLQEDNTVVPVAFLDTAVYVSEAKSMGNFVLLGDVIKSVWFVGFDAEPYRMLLLSKDVVPVDVNCADFLPHDGNLYFVVGDNQMNLHVLQYDPDDPVSVSGQRLVRKSTFNLNTVPTCMHMFQQNVVVSCTDGSFCSVLPLKEDVYRKLYVLQQQLIDKEEHALGLNPRMNRLSSEYDAVNSSFAVAKNLIDYDILEQFVQLRADRRRQLAIKAGHGAYKDIWRSLVEIAWKRL